MNDAEMLMLCRDAMGYTIGAALFNPLRDDEHAMALVKKFGLTLGIDLGNKQWNVHIQSADPMHTFNTDLNHAIVECVAKMQQGRNSKA